LKRPSRRSILRGLACCGVAAIGIDTLAVEPRWLSVSERDVPVPGLPTALEGLIIAQLSDLHLSAIGSIEEQVLAAIRSRQPAFVFISGDAVEETASLSTLSELVSQIRTASAAQVFATMGNWEHWGSVSFSALQQVYAAAGATLLGNEGRVVDRAIVLIATDDHCTGADDLGAALRFTPEAGDVRLLLTHAPGLLDRLPAGASPFHQAFAGHTHGGQVRPGFALWTPPGSGRYVAGAYETSCGPAYVSRGIGTSVLAARLGCRPELPFFRLVRA
jgi:predicted MPP superfamily phosphohydrolase